MKKPEAVDGAGHGEQLAIAPPSLWQPSGNSFKPSSKRTPCPICNRTKDGDCRISDDLVLCHHGSTHSPPPGLKPGDLHPGHDGRHWAFTGNTKDGRAAVFTIDKPRQQGHQPRPWSPPDLKRTPTHLGMAKLPEAAPEPPKHWPDRHRLTYSPDQFVEVRHYAKGKAFKPNCRSADAHGGWAKTAGPNPWPLWHQQEALQHGPGHWIFEAEGEKCAEWFRAAGFVGISQPGHDHKLESITARYGALKAAGVKGIVYVSDNDKTGSEKALKLNEAAHRVGLELIIVKASECWEHCPKGGSIDDGEGSAADRVHVIHALAQQRLTLPNPPEQPEPLPQEPITFEDQWQALEDHASELACQPWPVMKAIASLSRKASELEIPRLGQRQLEQLLEQGQRRVRAKAKPVEPGGSFTIKATPWAVQGIFRHGLNLLVGQSGAGKSRLAAACMAAWLRGDDTWIGQPLNGDDPRHRHALIIGTDQPLEDWHLTLGPVGLTRKISDTEVEVHSRLTLYGLETGLQLDADGLSVIRRWVDAHPGGMVLIDSLSACLPPGIDEDKSSAARPVHQLQEVLGDAWAILTHHTRKGAGKEGNLGVGAGRGSGAIDAAVSRVVGLGLIHKMENGQLVPQESDPRRELISTKRGGKTQHLIVSSDATGFWNVHGTAEALKAQERQERTLAGLTEAQSDVLSAVESVDGWITTRGVIEALGDEYDRHSGRAATVRKVLKRLEVMGLIESTRTGSDRSYRAKVSHCEQREDELKSSPGSPVAAQGISLAHPDARVGSPPQGEPPEPVGEPGEPGELAASQGEPEGEPPKTLQRSGVSKVSHPPCSPLPSTGSPLASDLPDWADPDVGELVF
jgi:predicted transcriptional regulator